MWKSVISRVCMHVWVCGNVVTSKTKKTHAVREYRQTAAIQNSKPHRLTFNTSIFHSHLTISCSIEPPTHLQLCFEAFKSDKTEV